MTQRVDEQVSMTQRVDEQVSMKRVDEQVSMTYYVSDPQFERYNRYTKSVEELVNINTQKQHSDNIHIILMNNGTYDENEKLIIKNNVINILTNLITTHEHDHVAIICYGASMQLIFEVLPLKDNIIDHIKNIIEYKCHGCIEDISKEMLIDAINNRSIINISEFQFISQYPNLFIEG
jgi:hypothetical protein